MEKLEVFIIPTPLMGHAGQPVDLARMLVNRFHHITATILVMKLPGDTVGTDYTDSLTSSQKINNDHHDRINFIHFPPMDIDLFAGFPPVSALADEVTERHKPIIRNLVASRSNGPAVPRLGALIVDMFCTTMLDVGKEFGIPSYVFFTSNAAFLGIMLHFQTLHDEQDQEISELANSNTELMIPSYGSPVPPGVLPFVLIDKESWSKRFLRHSRKYREAKGPMLKPEKTTTNSEVLQWLDGQPKSTVLFLCFGSRGWFNGDQVKELAIAIERSGYRFIWSLRRPPSEDVKGFPVDYTDYNEVLPDGFLERTANRGKVVGWVPQTELLAHVAVGGFVSHCGWNSILESLWYGVPIATWPMYAEQQLDALQLVKELGLAVEICLDYQKLNKNQRLISASDIEKGIRAVMDSNSTVRANVTEMKAKSRMALEEGGSSSASLKRFVDDFMYM
uniref:anthocyanidin 3-O-glucosyltransferase 2-like isoform X2 n=1 Tax=Erigeron canadensis TaxID=72917 RepID=UPI001CB892CB|nr:anthocyanidin 3-O-glucosyltransferase 2-like isoform X2 [Erigeron canadensis]